MLVLGYNTNGLAHHRLRDAFTLLAGLGYGGVALTPDVGELDLLDLDAARVRALRRQAEDLGLALAVETGARYVLDPFQKHRPNLLDPAAQGRARRSDYYRRSIDLAVDLGARVVSLWSGAALGGAAADAPDADAGACEPLWERLTSELRPLLEYAHDRGVRLAFEPEPGMFIERPAGYRELVRRLGPGGERLGLTLDLGHLVVTGDVPVGDRIREFSGALIHVHLDDAVSGVHEHLQLGAGELDLQAALRALHECGYGGMAAVELSRDSHRAPAAARTALERIRAAWPVPRRSC